MRPCQSVKSENLSESPGRGLFIGLAVYRSTFARTAPEAVVELIAKGVTLPDYPQAEVSVVTSADKASLNVRFVPVVYRKGIYQRINSFKLSVINMPISATTLAATRVATLATTENSVLSSGRFVKIRVSDTGVYRITQLVLRSGLFFHLLPEVPM